jgi:hypothetical protein
MSDMLQFSRERDIKNGENWIFESIIINKAQVTLSKI